MGAGSQPPVWTSDHPGLTQIEGKKMLKLTYKIPISVNVVQSTPVLGLVITAWYILSFDEGRDKRW